MSRILFAVIAALLLASCQEQSSGDDYTTKYYDDGRSKPSVAIVPVIDSTSYEVSWSLSEEFSLMIRKKLSRNGSIYLSKEFDTKTAPALTHNPFSNDISWVKQAYPKEEFIVFCELVEHSNMPVEKSNAEKIMSAEKLKEVSTNLNMGMRIRVIDLRRAEPKIVLQELIKDSYFISKNHIDTDYSLITWGIDEYETSPMGMAHNMLSKEVAERIEDYVSLAKSR